jgi:hypothetical protein
MKVIFELSMQFNTSHTQLEQDIEHCSQEVIALCDSAW